MQVYDLLSIESFRLARPKVEVHPLPSSHLSFLPTYLELVAAHVRRQARRLPAPQRPRVDARAGKVLPPVDEPLHRGDEHDDGEGDDTVVHILARHGQLGREEEEDGRDDYVGNADLTHHELFSGRLARDSVALFGLKLEGS